MYYQLLDMLKGFENIDIEQTPNFIAISMLRDKLHALGLDKEFASEIAIRCEIDLGEYSADEIEELITPFAALAYRVVEAFLKAGFSREGTLVGVTSQLTIKCD